MEYLGKSIDRRQCELLAMRIDPTHRENQADLIQTRWFDYSHMHPVEATYLYAHLYKEQTRIFCETCIDIRSAENARAFTPDDIFMSRDMTAMWLARSAADAIGMPYEFALRFAQERAINRLFQCYPRPNQIYGEEFEIDLSVAWKELLATSLRYSRLDRFKVKNSVGSLIQKRHIIFVIGQIKQRPAPHYNLLARMFSEGILSRGVAEPYFTEEVLDRACSVAATLDAQS